MVRSYCLNANTGYIIRDRLNFNKIIALVNLSESNHITLSSDYVIEAIAYDNMGEVLITQFFKIIEKFKFTKFLKYFR